MRKPLLLAALLLATASMAIAQNGPLFRVHGRVNPAENQTPGSPVAGIPGAPSAARGNTVRLAGETAWGVLVDRQALIAGGGMFEFPDVPPGFYQVEVIPRMSLPNADITVRDRDVAVNVGRAWIRLSGTVTVEGGGPVPPFELEFANVPANEADKLERRYVVQAGGRFTVDMPDGRYRIAASGLPSAFRLVNGAQPVEVSAAVPADLALVLNTTGAAPWVKVAGRIDGGAGANPGKVTLTGPGAASPIAAAVNPDGSFEFPKVLAGRYEARVAGFASTVHPITVGATDVTDFRIVLPGLRNAVGEFVRITPGVFTMGCPAGEPQCNELEKPAHRVGITRGFEIGKYEVTQAQWEAAMGTNPSEFKGPNRPVESVQWQDTQEFIARLNAIGDGYRYRLPTEAEWEYAARAGSSGPDPSPADTDAFGWFNTNSNGETHPVGQKQPNAWGLYDMRGNASEWVSDWYEPSYYALSPSLDPAGPPAGQQHVARGGHAGFNPVAGRTTSRLPLAANAKPGLRLVREPLQR
jgi:hypothetical protein